MKKQVNIFQIKEQDKAPETDPNGMKMWFIWQVPQNNGLKDAHWGQKKYAWTKWEVQQRDKDL